MTEVWMWLARTVRCWRGAHRLDGEHVHWAKGSGSKFHGFATGFVGDLSNFHVDHHTDPNV